MISLQNLPIKHILKRTSLLATVTLLGFGGWWGWSLYRDAAKLTGNNNPLQLVSAFKPAALKTVNGRVNILVAGYSDDDAGHQGADLTDSIMIVSLDPTNNKADIISVPRDLYVNIPGHGYSKINAAYEYGQADNFSQTGYAAGGMGLLEETLSQDFGVQFSYEALVNYTAFRDLVNAVGGVTVNIQSTNAAGIYDSNTGIQLPNGENSLTGDQALELARARGDSSSSYGFPNSDFDRTAHQQQIVLALKDKASQSSIIANPLKIGDLAKALGNNVKTDMQLNELETLYADAKKISDSNIETVTLNDWNGANLLSDYTTDDGQSALIPAAGVDDYTDIQSVVSQLLAPQPSAS